MEAPENTLQSFQHANRTGVDIIETDVRITKDGVILVCHDQTFERLCKPELLPHLKAKVSEMEWNNLESTPEFKQQMPLHFAGLRNSQTAYERAEGDQSSYSRLEDIFAALPKEQVIQVDIKDMQSEEAVRAVLHLVRKYERESTTIVGCLSQRNNNLIRRLNPRLPTFLTYEEFGLTFFYLLSGLLPFVSLPYDIVPAPYLTHDYMKMKLEERAEATGLIKRTSYLLFLLAISIVNKTANGLFSHLNKRGIVTCYWVLNDDEEIAHVMNATTVQGIMTDRPSHVKQFLRSH
mmetsp:Transcript_8418/g.14091  ORF Transcript_8418/g.14091 Transcript_8418/m.14091 type:complete len:292 (+) Transcript_8418:225-1100(+)